MFLEKTRALTTATEFVTALIRRSVNLGRMVELGGEALLALGRRQHLQADDLAQLIIFLERASRSGRLTWWRQMSTVDEHRQQEVMQALATAIEERGLHRVLADLRQ